MPRKPALASIAAQLSQGTRHTKPNGKPNPPEAAKNVGGRPRRKPFVRLHLSVDEELTQYLEAAWHQHRLADGTWASGASAYVEDLLRADRERREGKTPKAKP